jgi:hypothetical protein
MRPLSALTLLMLSASLALAQDHNKQKLCDTASASTVDHDAGVIVQTVTLSGKWGRNNATVYLPDKEIAEGAVVFSHSSLHVDGATTDLLPLALTLARAGAAVIVPERSLLWPPKAQSTNREGAVVICAEHWLIDHSNIFHDGKLTINEKNIVVRWGYAYVGPRVCHPATPSDCDLTDPFGSEDAATSRYHRHGVWVPVGETEGGDNTARFISDGGSKAAHDLQRSLGSAPINALVAVPSSSRS